MHACVGAGGDEPQDESQMGDVPLRYLVRVTASAWPGELGVEADQVLVAVRVTYSDLHGTAFSLHPRSGILRPGESLHLQGL